MVTVASWLLSFIQGVLVFCLGYHYLLALVSLRAPRPSPMPLCPRTHFAVAIPAHNEETVLSATLHQFQRQEYPHDLFDVHVVADHCTDATVEIARRAGAIVHERNSLPQGRKAYALQWLLARILNSEADYDAVAIFDADSWVAPDFLRVMDSYLIEGHRVLQGQHIISNPQDSPLAAMAAVDMRLNNRLRNQSRRNIGFACRLMGDAMVFEADILREYGWLGNSLTEDREYGYELLLRGIRAVYVPEAHSFGQAASDWKQAEPQRLRWYQGLVAMQHRLTARLLIGAIRHRSVVLLDGALELLMPSYSFLLALTVLTLGVVSVSHIMSLPLYSLLGVTGSLLLVVAWGFYPWLGLIIDRAPLWAFKALLLGPAYLAWRLWISLLVRLRGDHITWVRTRRREETKKEIA